VNFIEQPAAGSSCRRRPSETTEPRPNSESGGFADAPLFGPLRKTAPGFCRAEQARFVDRIRPSGQFKASYGVPSVCCWRFHDGIPSPVSEAWTPNH
jgi:hypothetical protein